MVADSIASPALCPSNPQLTEVPLAPWDPKIVEKLPSLPEVQCGSDIGGLLTHDHLTVPQAWGSVDLQWVGGGVLDGPLTPASKCVSALVSVA